MAAPTHPGNRFTYYQRQLIKQLVLEAEVQQLDRHQTLAYVNSVLKRQDTEISLESIDKYRKRVWVDTPQQVNVMRQHRTAFLNEVFFKRRDELRKLQKEQWRIVLTNANNPTVQQNGLKELHQLTITLANLWEALPQLTGLSYLKDTYNGEKNITEALERARTGTGSAEGESAESAEGRDGYHPVV